jgi:type I restriction enzyme S subunit
MMKAKLSQILSSLESGGRPKGGASLDNNGIPSLGAEHLDGNGGFNFKSVKYIPEDYFNGLKSGIIEKENILIVKDGATTGKVSFVSDEFPFDKAAVNEHVFLLKIDISKAYPRFAFQYLKCPQGQRDIMRDFRGATVGGISRGFVDFVKFVLPPFPEQLHIATILSKAENLIAQRKESIRLLDEFLKSTFLEMFGEPVTNPKGWGLKTLDKISNIGSSKRVFVEELVDSGIPFFRGTEIGHLGEGKNITPTLYITKEHFEELKSHTGVPVIGDLLMPSICPDGRIFRVVNNESFYFKDGRVLWVKPDQNIVNSFYLHNTLKRLFITNYNKIASGTTFAELKIVALKKIQVPMPPFELQTQFAQIVEKTEALKSQYQQSLQELENLYGSLSQRAFRGELSRK